ncbi:MAG: hypothetical protein Q8S21_04120 [Candidatus Paracaedibacteraceae bacterium]|nr:hypothetical protein [Candidatus Paracaedibacteraceae bacterium]
MKNILKKTTKNYVYQFALLSSAIIINLGNVRAAEKQAANNLLEQNINKPQRLLCSAQTAIAEDETTDDSGGSREGSLSKRPEDTSKVDGYNIAFNQSKKTIEIKNSLAAKQDSDKPLTMLERFKERAAKVEAKNAENKAKMEELYRQKVKELSPEIIELRNAPCQICSEYSYQKQYKAPNTPYKSTRECLENLNISSLDTETIAHSPSIEYIDQVKADRLNDLYNELIAYRKELEEHFK